MGLFENKNTFSPMVQNFFWVGYLGFSGRNWSKMLYIIRDKHLVFFMKLNDLFFFHLGR